MVEIISKRDGPRREDVAARQLIERNRGTIDRIAGHLTGGAYTRDPAASAPAAKGPTVHVLGGPPARAEPKPYVRISPNGRVVMVDRETGRQMHLLGEIRAVAGAPRFLLATAENGFFSRLDSDLAGLLAALDRQPVAGRDAEALLEAEIGERLGVV